MFSKIIDTLRNTNRNIPDTETERRLSTTKDDDNNNNINNNNNNNHHQPPALSLTKMHTTGSLPSTTNSIDESTQSIPITRRRRSSLFGYSQNSADDYMQKDLVSSSWS